jgi:GTP-binding protein
VGKSSLINTLVNRKRLVKTSGTPGRTQLINFFAVNGRFSFVDLPGYGYAKVPLAVKKRWGPMIETYLAGRDALAGVVLILDIRREPRTEEFDFMAWLDRYGIESILVLTKTDKLSRTRQLKQQSANAAALDVDPDRLILFSARTRKGREKVWDAVVDVAARKEERR